jgi:hypothetical protein
MEEISDHDICADFEENIKAKKTKGKDTPSNQNVNLFLNLLYLLFS